MRRHQELRDVAGEFARLASLLVSVWSLYGLLHHAFFIPGTEWKERLVGSLAALGLSACTCVAGGIIFCLTDAGEQRLSRTLPVVLLKWAVAATIILFGLSWYLAIYYVPLLWKSQPW
jgi:hypothetical protein